MTNRQAFETEARKHGFILDRLDKSGVYVQLITEQAWSIWQAATAAALERAAEVCETILDELSFANAYECSNECADAIRALKDEAMNQRNDTSRAMTQKQREAIMRLLPSTVGKMATALGLPTRSVWKRLKTLEEQKAAQVVAQGSGKVQIWGYWTGVPYVHQRVKPLPIPESPYKTRWIGGRYPGFDEEVTTPHPHKTQWAGGAYPGVSPQQSTR